MNSTAPRPEHPLDHLGEPLPLVPMASLSYEQVRLGLDFHEAGHAVLSMAYGMQVVESRVIAWQETDGTMSVTGKTRSVAAGVSPWRYAAQCAAGEQAHIRYLKQTGLWTPELEAGCAALHDRELAIDVLAQFGFRLGRGHAPIGGKSWPTIQAVADRTVTLLWPHITTVAHAMDQQTQLTGDEIAELAGLTNPDLGGAA
ncbi:hypothetical protein Slala03_62640 [Streptomyces lavendulae subsp. lavendulae]|uniref:hypothetical protein n=1 Tax=Streptomyces lavendulae TaxID=1914 RepID=UPI0024A0D702|nr:hypothetical protein [Streptomyces lavendulae]GLV86575.1 hypothetical protein Slala03_62640 [Streptomyces lavendulae subsp. lavendulae]